MFTRTKNIIDFIPTLIKNIDILESKLNNIAESWISNSLVLDVMKKHKISPSFFKDEYAIKVLEYFFDVVKGKKQVGSCPIIDKLLIYLKDKDISADELFIICTHARKAVIYEIFRQKIASYKLISEISLLFDLNFSGVLKQYADTIYRLQKKVDEEIKSNRDKDLIILEQLRLAQMGEMISMIAHQWRQPLGAISANSMDIKMQSEFGHYDLRKVEDAKAYQEYVHDGLLEIDNLVKNLTNTIDDFRNFNKPDKESKLMGLEEICIKVLKIIRLPFKNDNIEIYENYNSTKKYNIYDSEMIQVIIDIFKNANYNFKEKGTKNPRITISTEGSVITICDNGGGIPEDVLPKIFDPYFSTKDDKNGTGLGLYMSKTIVEEHHKGKLEAINRDDGVCFSIDLIS